MDATPEVQIILIVTFLVFLGFLGLILYLAVMLLSKQTLLRKAHGQLEDYAQNLEAKVHERTSDLAASEAKYRSLFQHTREAILITDKLSGVVLYHNHEAEIVFGYSQDLLRGLRVQELISPETALTPDGSWRDCSIKTRDRGTRMADLLAGDIYFDGRDCLQIICRDITEKRELEVQLIQAQKMADMGQFAAGIAHELRTPLGSIENAAFLVRESIKQSPEAVDRNLEIISSQIDRCQKIIMDLLAISKAPSPSLELELTDVNILINRFFSVINKELRSRDINLAAVLVEGMPLIRIDPHRLTQVFANLISNAVQAMPTGGRITIKSWVDQDRNCLLEDLDDANVIHISVEDTGAGIPSDALARVFDPFFSSRREQGGMGLGLHVSYGIIKQFRGNITVKSKIGEGAAFTVHLPVLR